MLVFNIFQDLSVDALVSFETDECFVYLGIYLIFCGQGLVRLLIFMISLSLSHPCDSQHVWFQYLNFIIS